MVVTRPSPDKVANLFSRGVIIRGKEIVYDRKMVSQHTKILKYLPNLLLLEDSKQLVVYAGKGRYKLTEFVFKVNIKLNNFLCVQGVLYDSEAGQEKMIKYYICSLNQLFSSH